MATTSREARRRKIIDRSSDRLALITGRLQSLPPPSDHHSPSSVSDHPANTPSVSSDVENEAFLSVLPEGNNSANAGASETVFTASRLVPPITTSETNAEPIETVSDAIPLLSATDETSLVSTLATERHVELEPRTEGFNFFSPNEISCAVAATERTRLCCSVAFAVAVVLSHIGFPILGNRLLKGILGFRPLFLVLLTNVTGVVAQILEKQRSETADRRGSRATGGDGNDLVGQLGKTLEIGLLLQKVANAVFMDCAVYAVIVVCGLSFAEKLR